MSAIFNSAEANGNNTSLVERVYNLPELKETIKTQDGQIWVVEKRPVADLAAHQHPIVAYRMNGEEKGNEFALDSMCVISALDESASNTDACSFLSEIAENPLSPFSNTPTVSSKRHADFCEEIISHDEYPTPFEEVNFGDGKTFIHKEDPRYMVVTESFGKIMFIQTALEGADAQRKAFAPLARVRNLDEASAKIKELSASNTLSRHEIPFRGCARYSIGHGFVDVRTVHHGEHHCEDGYLQFAHDDISFQLSYSSPESKIAHLVSLKDPANVQRALSDYSFAQKLCSTKAVKIKAKVHPDSFSIAPSFDDLAEAIADGKELNVKGSEDDGVYIRFCEGGNHDHEPDELVVRAFSLADGSTFFKDLGYLKINADDFERILKPGYHSCDKPSIEEMAFRVERHSLESGCEDALSR